LPESTAIIDLAYGRCRDDNSHWQNVLKYCKDGCFQAMIDEYIHMLKETAGFQSDGNQYQIVHDMMMDSLRYIQPPISLILILISKNVLTELTGRVMDVE